MNKKFQLGRAHLLTALFLAAANLLAAKLAAADSETITMTVTAVGKKVNPPPEVKKEDVQLYQGRERTQVADWKGGGTLYLAVLIDDSLDSSIANQWNDLKAFLLAQPDTTYIAVAYARNGTAMVAQDFTKDHTLAAKALRLPLGSAGAFTSPYLALQDWITRWPDSNARKSIILFSSGIDYFRGSFDPVNPDVDTTIEQAQKKNINIWTIYAPDAGHWRWRSYVLFISQSFLSRVSEETGTESYYLDFGPPVTLKPYFDEIQTHLNNQYLLSFAGSGGPQGRFERVRVATELPGVEFLAAPQAFLPAAK
ncbi:MAG: vWA domain-containing protein [Candidatus Acidiferrum sp.]